MTTGDVPERMQMATADASDLGPVPPQYDHGHGHIGASGRFVSDKYVWCRIGYFALKFTDPKAWHCLLSYAQAVEETDAGLADDIRRCVDREMLAADAKVERGAIAAERGEQATP